MSSKTVDPADVVPSGFGEIAKRRAVELTRAASKGRSAKSATARSRISAAKGGKKGRAQPLGPTPARLAKGDIDVRAGMHRAIPPVERLRDQGKLATPKPSEEIERLKARGEFSYDVVENQRCYEAALRLYRHYEGMLQGVQGSVQAQDLNKIIGSGGEGDCSKQEAWVIHRDFFREAVTLMGCYDNPFKGCGRIVVAVVCSEMSIRDAAEACLPDSNQNAKQSIAMDRLRTGLFTLAMHWRT